MVGNNDYRNVPKLQKAVNDARTMGDTLKQLGFTVMVAENQTRQAFSQTLLAFDKSVEPGDTAFFFYAGHGFEIVGQNFLLPTDVPAATEGQEELVRDASVLADRIIERLQNRKVLGISWRIGEAGDFRETGFMDALDPRTRKRMPNPSIQLPADAPPPPSSCAMSTPMAICRDRSRSGSIRKPRSFATSARSSI